MYQIDTYALDLLAYFNSAMLWMYQIDSYALDLLPYTLILLCVNTKNWYKRGTDLWAEFGNEIPFDRKNLLRGFGKDACGRQYTIIWQKDCLRL
jgi:hypothetical protein